MRIQHNIMAMSAYRNYTNNVSAMKKNLEKLSSGYKINRAGDDAAGLAISEKMRAQITGLETAQKNAKDGISLVQTAEGALTEVHDMLNRMVELATQSANGTYDNTTDRAQMQKEVNQLLDEIDRIADSSNFNGINLLDGTLGLNTDTFKISSGDSYTAAVNPDTIDLTSAVSNYHGGKSVTGTAPSFKIDLNDIEINNTHSSATNVKFKITAGSLVINATSTNTVAAGGKASANQIKNAIKAALDAAATGTDGNGANTIKIGGLYMKYTVTGTSVKFDYDSVGGTKAQAWATAVSGASGVTKANTFNNSIGRGVTVEAVGSKTKLTDGKTEIHALTDVKNAVADQPAQRPGVDINIGSLVKDGFTLTIAGATGSTPTRTTYVFKTEASNSKADAYTAATDGNETVVTIDVSMVEGATAQARQAALIMAGGAHQSGSPAKPDGNANGAHQTANIFTIGLKDGNTTLHIDVTTAANASKADSEAKMRALITAKDAGADEVVASTKLYVTGTAKEGNVLNIGSDKITFKGGEDIDAIKTAIAGKGYTVTKKTDADGKAYLNIEGKATGKDENGKTVNIAAKDRTAPQILGKGLTLQIGDTSDSWNQLNVAVQDMHSGSIGVGKLKIDTEEAAQAAIDKIKKAINTVSDVRGTLGATQNRLDHTINNLSVMTENIQDAESTIRDVDVAEEMMAYTKNNILIQSAQAMLAQANQVPQGVLQLLQ